MNKKFYITAAIPYVNAAPHIGHALEFLQVDVVARYKILQGNEATTLTGSDENALKNVQAAEKAGQEVQEFVDRNAQLFLELTKKLNTRFDVFQKGTDPGHFKSSQDLWTRCNANGDIYKKDYEGLYCVGCEAFKQEKDLVEGLCPIHTTRPDWIKEKNYFFRLSAYRDRLLAHFAEHPGFLQPDIRRNEILRLLEGGLDDISISRAGQAWGIPLPFDTASVVYVWVDALINYASAVGLGSDPLLFDRWWPADLHVIGKDITRFHCVVWPAMLMSAGLPLPRQVFGHGWVHFKGQKMSKSLGTAVDPLEAAGRLGPDPLRLYLVKEIPYGGDGDFSWERFEERYNADLANNLGNLTSRLTTMVERYRGGRLDPPSLGAGRLATVAETSVATYRAAMDRHALHEATAAAYRLVDATNEFIAETTPWSLARDASARERLDQVLFDATEALRVAAVLLLPVIPASAAEILRRAGEPTPAASLDLSRDACWKVDLARTTHQGPALWPRLDTTSPTADTAASVEKTPVTEPTTPPSTPAPADATPGTGAPPAASNQQEAVAPAVAPGESVASARIGIDDFMKVDLRVATVVTAERVPKSKKLVKLQVDVGAEQRTLVAGIAEAYEPEALVGRTVVIVANLQPAKLMGIESNGMVLAASPDGGLPELVTFASPPAAGTRVR